MSTFRKKTHGNKTDAYKQLKQLDCNIWVVQDQSFDTRAFDTVKMLATKTFEKKLGYFKIYCDCL